MTQACIHLGTHELLVATCPSRDSKDMAHDIMRQESIATPSTNTMLANKVFLGHKLIRPNDGSQSKLQGEEFDLLLEESKADMFLSLGPIF